MARETVARLIVRDPFDARLGCCVQHRLTRLGTHVDEGCWHYRCPECGTFWDGDENGPTDRTVVEEVA